MHMQTRHTQARTLYAHMHKHTRYKDKRIIHTHAPIKRTCIRIYDIQRQHIMHTQARTLYTRHTQARTLYIHMHMTYTDKHITHTHARV